MKSVDRLIITVPLCVTLNYAVALFIFSSTWGSVLVMDDQFSRITVLVPVAAGLVLGLVQAIAFGPQATLLAMAVGVVGVVTLLLAFTLLTQAVGIAAGCFAVWAIRSLGDNRAALSEGPA